MPPATNLTLLATLPAPHFLENLAPRHDSSLLLTVYDRNQLYLLPSSTHPSTPILLHTFSHHLLGITELSPDEFFVSVSTGTVPNSSSLWRVDMSTYVPGTGIAAPQKVLDIPAPALQLNGSCAISVEQRVLLLADSWAGLIWRVDLAGSPKVGVWLDSAELKRVEDGTRDAWGGVNGVRFSEREGAVFFKRGGRGLFCRVGVDVEGGGFGVRGEVEVLATGWLGDDLCLDDEREVAYVTTHPENTVDRVGYDGVGRETVVGKPVDERMLCPTAVNWSGVEGEKGKVLIAIATGGIVAPIEGGVRDATVVRIEV